MGTSCKALMPAAESAKDVRRPGIVRPGWLFASIKETYSDFL
jgi:hypothetical protein